MKTRIEIFMLLLLGLCSSNSLFAQSKSIVQPDSTKTPTQDLLINSRIEELLNLKIKELRTMQRQEYEFLRKEADFRAKVLFNESKNLYYFFSFFLVLASIPALAQFIRYRRIELKMQEKLLGIESKAERAPDKIRYQWDLAREKMESYFNKNLSQIGMIFWISVLVMFVGFVLFCMLLTFLLTKQAEQEWEARGRRVNSKLILKVKLHA